MALSFRELRVLRIIGRRFGFSGIFYLHIAKFFRIEDFATLQALDELAVFLPGDDSNPGMSARAWHCSYSVAVVLFPPDCSRLFLFFKWYF